MFCVPTDSRAQGSSGQMSGRGNAWQGPGRGGASSQNMSDRGRDSGSKNLSGRGQGSGLVGKGSGPQSGSNQQSWGSGGDRRQEGSGSASRQGDRWAGGGSMVQPDARPIAYQAMGAPPIVANVPTGMFVATTSMAPGTIMMAPTNLQGQNRQQDQRFDAYKSLGNIRRY